MEASSSIVGDQATLSYSARILIIAPLYQKLGSSSLDICQALCMKSFMGRHCNISDLEQLSSWDTSSGILVIFPSIIQAFLNIDWSHSNFYSLWILSSFMNSCCSRWNGWNIATSTHCATMTLQTPKYGGTCSWWASKLPCHFWLTTIAQVVWCCYKNWSIPY